MENEGKYIKICHSMLDWEWYKNINTKTLFLHMLLKANWKEGRFEGITVPSGSLVSSYTKLSAELGLTVNEVRTALKHLVSTGEITVKSYSKFSIFTVVNYGQYQEINSQSTVKAQAVNSQITDKSQEINSQLKTVEKRIKERKKRDITISNNIVCQPEVKRDVECVVEEWNRLGINPVSKISASSTRYKMISARIKEYGLENVIQAVRRIQQSDFLRGGSKKGWTIDLEWFAKPNNFPKVYEGKYDDKTQSNMSIELEEWINEED